MKIYKSDSVERKMEKEITKSKTKQGHANKNIIKKQKTLRCQELDENSKANHGTENEEEEKIQKDRKRNARKKKSRSIKREELWIIRK